MAYCAWKLELEKDAKNKEQSVVELIAQITSDVVAGGERKIEPFKVEEFEGLTIRLKKAQTALFKLNKPQKKLLKMLNEQIRAGQGIYDVLLKARQFGGSTFYMAVLYLLCMKYAYRVVIISQDIDSANNLWKKFKLYYQRDPWPEKPNVVSKGRREYIFSNGGEVWVGSAGVGSVRNQTNQAVLISELPKWLDVISAEAIDEQLLGLLSTVPDTGQNFVFFESTARGFEEFHRRYEEAKNGLSEYHDKFIGWTDIEEYVKAFNSPEERDEFIKSLTEEENMLAEEGVTPEQLLWRRWCIRNKCKNDVEMFRQEYPYNDVEAFLVTGRPVFDQAKLGRMLRAVPEPIWRGEMLTYSVLNWKEAGVSKEIRERGLREAAEGRLKVWEWPEDHEDYHFGIDVAEGIEVESKKSDGSAINIMRRKTKRTVAVWYGQCHPEELADMAQNLGIMYNNAKICVEANNHGLTTVTRLEKQYTRLYRMIVGEEEGHEKRQERIGFYSSKRSKGLAIDQLAIAIRGGEMDITDGETIRQLLECSYGANGRVNTHGKDLVTALMLSLECFYSQKEEYNKVPRIDNYDESFRKWRKEIEEQAAIDMWQKDIMSGIYA